MSHVLHHYQMRAAATVAHDNAMQVNHINVIQLPHHLSRHYEIQAVSLCSRLAQRFYGYRGPRSTSHYQMTLAYRTKLTCDKRQCWTLQLLPRGKEEYYWHYCIL